VAAGRDLGRGRPSGASPPLRTPCPCALILAALVFAAALAPGCAVAEIENRRLLNLLDEHVKPESTGLKIALAPVGVPVGTAALAVDMVIVHPVSVIPDAADDVYELYWKPRDMDWLRK
jgi:hypothetical protein